MKKMICMFFVICTMFLCACANEVPEESLTPTGYPSGEIGQPQVMYEGRIYYYQATGFNRPLPDGYEQVGTVIEIDNLNEPDQDFQGARLELDQKVYANKEDKNNIYVEYKNGFAKFSANSEAVVSDVSAPERNFQSVSGEITSVVPGSNTGEFFFSIRTEKEKGINCFFTEDTSIITWPEGIAADAFRTQPNAGAKVLVFYEDSVKNMKTSSGVIAAGYDAVTIYIEEALVEEEAVQMPDGVAVDVWRGYRYTSYRLKDGTELLREDRPAGPEDVSVGGVGSLDDLNEAAQEKIIDYYSTQGLRYDIYEELANAYNEFTELEDGKGVVCYSLERDILPVSTTDEIITFVTTVRQSTGGKIRELQGATVFDRETGEVVNGWDLFTCSEGEAKKVILDCAFAQMSGNKEVTLRAEMDAALQAEYVVLYPDRVEVVFPPGVLPSSDVTNMLWIDYDEGILRVLQEWAVPSAGESK